MISQFRRCFGLAFARRGYQAMGTESLRPSASETINSSSVTSSPTASGSFGLSKVLIPFLQVSSYVVTHNAVNLV